MAKSGKGFSLIEVLIVVAIILIIAGVAVPTLLSARMTANQSSAVATMHTLTVAETAYSALYNGGFSADMSSLFPPAAGASPSSTAAGLIDNVLASGAKSGYSFTYSPGPTDSTGRVNAFSFSATPIGPSTGVQYYYVDESGVIRQNATTAAGPADPPIGELNLATRRDRISGKVALLRLLKIPSK